MDDWELRQDVQESVAKIWPAISTENLHELSDISGFKREFLRLFGFGIDGVNYDADVDI